MQFWEGYETLLDKEGLLVDTATGSTITALSDTLAQATEKAKDRRWDTYLSPERVGRYAVFGAIDGFAGHNWFEALDASVPRSGEWVADTLLKVTADSLFYTPGWCVVFLCIMAILEGRGVAGAISDLRRDYLELLRGNYGFTLPFVILIYGLVPVRFQVAGFAALTLAYTIVLSLWENARSSDLDSKKIVS